MTHSGNRDGAARRRAPARSVCVLGLGRMGAAMAHRLRSGGLPVSVWDRRADRVAELVTAGAETGATPAAAAAGRDVVLLAVADWSAVAEVMFGPDGVLGAGPHPGVVLSTSTLAPDDVVRLAGHTPAVLDVGLQGNHQHALEGQLRLYVGGPAGVLDRVRPVLERLGQQVRHVGALGTGMRLKLVMNLLMGVEMQVMAEAVVLGAGLGLDRGLVLDAITHSGFTSPVMSFKARRLATGDYAAPDFRLRLMAKDLRLALAAAARAGVELPVVRAAGQLHERAVAHGLGDQDCAAILEAVATAVPATAPAAAPSPDAAPAAAGTGGAP